MAPMVEPVALLRSEVLKSPNRPVGKAVEKRQEGYSDKHPGSEGSWPGAQLHQTTLLSGGCQLASAVQSQVPAFSDFLLSQAPENLAEAYQRQNYGTLRMRGMG